MSQVEGMEQLVTTVSLALPGAVAQPAYRHLCQELMNRRERLKKVVNSTQIIIIITHVKIVHRERISGQ